MSAAKLTASQLMVIVDTLYRSLRVANYSGMYDEKTRQETLEDVVKILDGVRLSVVEEPFNPLSFAEDFTSSWNETGGGV
jgi:hypothetical protein